MQPKSIVALVLALIVADAAFGVEPPKLVGSSQAQRHERRTGRDEASHNRHEHGNVLVGSPERSGQEFPLRLPESSRRLRKR